MAIGVERVPSGVALPTALPPMLRVRQTFPRPRVSDVPAAVHEALLRVRLHDCIRPGMRVAVTAGSRGIRDLVAVLQAVVREVRAAGGDPLLVGAMGSHGGGTEEGQRRLLAHLGVTSESVGAPLRTSMETVDLGRTPGGLTAYCGRIAASCDRILIVNRIKPHTGFREPFGSGLMKMIGVGLGNAPGAAQIHREGAGDPMARAIREIAETLLASGRIIGGVAIVENAYDETAEITGVPPEDLPETEIGLFAKASALMARLPVERMHALIVDEMGKTYSGTGMDVNVIGRWRIAGVPEPASPHVDRIVVLRLSAASEGNAQGIGLADFTTRALVGRIDYTATYLNCLVSTYVQRAMLPMVLATERDAILASLSSLGLADPREAGIVRIPNTLALEHVWVSEPLVRQGALLPHAAVETEPEDFQFDPAGALLS
jgi:Lactate racemase N-terminal domain